jgi:hypothetical protein
VPRIAHSFSVVDAEPKQQVFPSTLGQLRKLSSLLLSHNSLTNTIDVSVLLKLTGLRALRLHRNQIIGIVPRQLAQLTDLEVLSLRDNFLQGPIPTEFGRVRMCFSKFVWIWVPASPMCAQMTRLQELYLYGNRLSGSVPTLKSLKLLTTCSLSCPENACADGADNCFDCPLDGLNSACIVSARCGDCVDLRIVVPTDPPPAVEPPPNSWLAPVLLCLGPLLGAMALMGLAWYNQRDFEKRNELARM